MISAIHLYRAFLREARHFYRPDLRESLKQEIRSQFKHYRHAEGALKDAALIDGASLLKHLKAMHHELHHSTNDWPW